MWHQPRSWTVYDDHYRILHVLFRWDLCKCNLPAKSQENRKLPKSIEATKIYERDINREAHTGTCKTQKHFAVDHQISVAKVGENDLYARLEKTSWCRKPVCCGGKQSGGLWFFPESRTTQSHSASGWLEKRDRGALADFIILILLNALQVLVNKEYYTEQLQVKCTLACAGLFAYIVHVLHEKLNYKLKVVYHWW